ncbi:MAG TPA: A24 family peptidase [Thermoleophilaceae bacterium]
MPSPETTAAQALPTPIGRASSTARLIASVGVGVAAAGAIARFGFGAKGLIAACFASVLIVLAAVDLERRIIPNRIVLPATAVIMVAQIAHAPGRTPEWILASVGTALFLFLPSLIRKNAMGMGDVKLGLLLGAGLGKHVLTGVTLGFLAVWPVAIVLFVRRGRDGVRDTAIPLGPFLAAGALVALFLD